MNMRYYTSREHLRKLMNSRTPKLALKTGSIHEYQTWKEDLRSKIRELLGFSVMQSAPLNPQTIESVQMDGYTRVKMTIDTEPDVTMPFYALIPGRLNLGEKHPAILAPHGHGSMGKEAVAGNAMFPEHENNIKYYNYGYGVEAVKAGFITFCPDARGFGERSEKYWQGDEHRLDSSCLYLNTMAMGLGTNTAGMWTWDLMRLIDYVQSRGDVQSDI